MIWSLSYRSSRGFVSRDSIEDLESIDDLDHCADLNGIIDPLLAKPLLIPD